jgi:hypothetical protein
MLLIFSVGVVAGIVFGILMAHEWGFTDFVLSTGMALAKTILRKQQKVGEHYAERYIVFDNVGSSFKSYRGVRLFVGWRLRQTGMPKIRHLLGARRLSRLGH